VYCRSHSTFTALKHEVDMIAVSQHRARARAVMQMHGSSSVSGKMGGSFGGSGSVGGVGSGVGGGSRGAMSGASDEADAGMCVVCYPRIRVELS